MLFRSLRVNRHTGRIEEPTCDPSASYSPSIAFVVDSNATYIGRLVLANVNTKKQRDCNIQMPIYLNQLNRLNMKHIYQLRIHHMKSRNIKKYIYGKMNNNPY